MPEKRTIISYITWPVFAGLTGILLYQSANRLIQSTGAIYPSYADIAIGLIAFIVVALTILCNFIATKKRGISNNKKSTVFEIIGYVIAIASFASVRYFVDSAIADNLQEFIIPGAAFLLAMVAVRILYGRVAGFIAGLGMALLPEYAIRPNAYDIYYVLFMFFATGLFLTALAKIMLSKKPTYYVAVLIAPLCLGILGYMESMCLPLMVLFVVLVVTADRDSKISKVIGIILALIMFVIGFLGDIILNSGTSSPEKLGEEVLALIQARTTGIWNYNHIFELANDGLLAAVFVLCLVYAVMFILCKYDSAYSMIIVLVCEIALMCYLDSVNNYSYVMVCILAFLSIAGAGIQKIVTNHYLNDEIKEIEEITVVEETPSLKEEEASSEEEPQFNMANLDWSKLRDAKLIDYPDPETVETEPEPVKISEPEVTPVANQVISEFDYEIPQEDMHFDVEF